MQQFTLIKGSCADQHVDVVVNAANSGLWAGGGICGGELSNPVAESTTQCIRAYRQFTEDYPDYDMEVLLCAFKDSEMRNAQEVVDSNHV